MKTKAVIAFIVSLLFIPASSEAGDTLLESKVIRTALAENPTLKAAKAKWAAMRERVPQAKAWDDPMIGVDFERMGTTQFSRYTDAEWMVSQTLPISGKNLSRARSAEAEARAAYEDVRRIRLDVLAQTRAAYFQLANAYAQLAINRKNERLLVQFVEISQAKYKVGGRSQADVLAAQTEVGRIEQERVRLAQGLSFQESALNVLMNRPATAPLGTPVSLAFKTLRWKQEEIEPLLLAQRPEISAAEQNIAAETARLQAAHRNWIPEPQIAVKARHFRGSSDTFTEYNTGIFFSIPWANPRKYSAAVREAEQSLESARRSHEAAKKEALRLLRDQFAKISSLSGQYKLSRDKIVPLAAQTVETLMAGYRADANGYLELLAAERTLREGEAAASVQLADYLAALAELNALVGLEDEPGQPNPSRRKAKK